MPTVETRAGTIHYVEEGSGTPLVLLHANPGDHRDYEAVLSPLAERHRVLAVDWPGYGLSELAVDPSSVDVLTYRDALEELLDALALPPAILVGNSIGGNVAARLAAEAPERVRALVLVAPGGFTPHGPLSRGFCRFMGSPLGLSPSRWARTYLKERTPTTEAMWARAAGEQATPERLALNRAMWRSFARPEGDLREVASRIAASTLLLFGARDPAIPPGKDGRVAAAAIPHARVAVLPCGHASFAELPDRFLGEVLPFLDGVA